MNNIVNLCFYADAYYSGNTYEENIIITIKLYEKIKDKLNELEIYIDELDGKHSEVECNLDVQTFSDDDIKNDWTQEDLDKNDGETCWERLYYLCNDLGFELDKDNDEALEYIKALIGDRIICKVVIDSKYLKKLEKFVKSIGGKIR